MTKIQKFGVGLAVVGSLSLGLGLGHLIPLSKAEQEATRERCWQFRVAGVEPNGHLTPAEYQSELKWYEKHCF